MISRLILPVALFAACAAPAAAQEKKTEPKSKVVVLPPAAKAPEAESAPALRAASAGAMGDTLTPPQIASQFFASLREGEIEKAYSALTKGSKIAERPEELRLLKQKTKEAIDVFGVISGFELVDDKKVGTRLMRSTYVSLGKEFPLRWRFYFYRADNVWRLVDLRVDDKLTGVFDEVEEPKTAEPK